MVVVVAAGVRFPDALDALAPMCEVEEAAAMRLAGRAFFRVASDEASGFHYSVAHGTVIGATVGEHADIGCVSAEVVGDVPVDGELAVVCARCDRDRFTQVRGHS